MCTCATARRDCANSSGQVNEGKIHESCPAERSARTLTIKRAVMLARIKHIYVGTYVHIMYVFFLLEIERAQVFV